ncbi:MAG: cobalamin biosynthesis protein CobD [bacterium]|nr:cobalamin biosynthesis protein CobD [bacterium]
MFDIICAVFLDLLLGDPPAFPHPIKVMGSLIAFEEKIVRRFAGTRGALRLGGGLLVLCNITLAFMLPSLLLLLLRPYPAAFHLVNIYLLYTCLAARCLRDAALEIYQALQRDINEARQRLSFIVGRETEHLHEKEIIRATVETVAENSSDGVIAPLLFAMLGGAPPALSYKMINTMDSMLGYMSEEYRDIGFFPAKIDDLVNYIPARLTGILMGLASLFRFPVLRGLKIMIRDRKNHKSPNCAYPEAAVAGLLGIQLGGDNVYFGKTARKPTLGDITRPLERQDIKRSCELMFRTELLCVSLYLLAMIFLFFYHR